MQLLALSPTTNITRVSNVPAVNLSLSGAAPETSVITATISNVPVLNLALTPPAPETNVTRVSDGALVDLTLTALAPTTTVIVAGLTVSDVPALNLSLNALAPSALRELISDVPAKEFVITGRAPTTTDPTAADTASTGGWGSYSPQYERETSEERKTRIRKEREDLGIIEVPSLPAKAKPARDDKGRFTRRLELSEAERTRLLNELEAMAQADRQNRQKAALLLLLL